MIIEGQGIRLWAEVRGSCLRFRVEEQSDDATDALKLLRLVNDDETGFSLKSNKRPSYSHNTKRFFVRGTEREYHDKTVVCNFKSAEEANLALQALQRMVAKVVKPQIVEDSNVHGRKMGKPVAGGTTHVRWGIIPRSIAVKLDLTAKEYYPDEPNWPEPAHVGEGSKAKIAKFPIKPICTRNGHYNEHIGQAVDVLNKHHMHANGIRHADTDASIVNPHKVSPLQGYQAVELLRRAFKEAEAGGFEVAFWRIVTGIRGPDFEDRPGDNDDNDDVARTPNGD